MDSKGVSPMIATIVLIAITFAIAGILIAGLLGAGAPTQPWGGNLAFEDAHAGSRAVWLKHMGGETLVNAFNFNPVQGTYDWINLEIRLNDVAATVDLTELWLSGQKITEERFSVNFATGDKVQLTFYEPLVPGDVIMLIYRGGWRPYILTKYTIS